MLRTGLGEFADDLLGNGFRDLVAFDFESDRLLEERASNEHIPLPQRSPRRIDLNFWQKIPDQFDGGFAPRLPRTTRCRGVQWKFQIFSDSLTHRNPVFFGSKFVLWRADGSLGGFPTRINICIAFSSHEVRQSGNSSLPEPAP